LATLSFFFLIGCYGENGSILIAVENIGLTGENKTSFEVSLITVSYFSCESLLLLSLLLFYDFLGVFSYKGAIFTSGGQDFLLSSFSFCSGALLMKLSLIGFMASSITGFINSSFLAGCFYS
jgi:hypothetical protein